VKLHHLMPALIVAYTTASQAVEPSQLPPLLAETQEIQQALEAAPEHLRSKAGVYVLETAGYRRIRESQNGFTCLIEREVTASFAPECFDAEGSASFVPVILYRAQQRARGVNYAAIERAVATGYMSGQFVAPRRVGICYMLSTQNVVVMDRHSGKVGPVGPHLMFYAPNLRNADFGSTPDMAAHFLIADEGSPTALIIVPVDASGDAHPHH
jgi:hypothetical protein